MLIYIGATAPYKSPSRSRIELVNEVFIASDSLHLLLFTDYARDDDT